MDKQTWGEEDSVSKQELRSSLLGTACSLNEDKCTQQAKSLFKQYTDSNGTIRYVKNTNNILFCLLYWVSCWQQCDKHDVVLEKEVM